MSWKTINRIIGLASINRVFRQQLQQNPSAALEAEDFEVTPEELETLSTLALLPFSEFCQSLLRELASEDQAEISE